MFVYILNQHGRPLMPCTPRAARLLLKTGKATVVKRVPFTLQLLYGSSGYTQEVSLGIDAGTRRVGVSATREGLVLFEAEAHLRTDIQELLARRRQMRRARRARKTRYRPCRFLNRKRPKGWLAPSVQHKVDSHLKIMQLVQKILPIRAITIEVAQFDLQKIRHPAIAGREYQQGPQLGFWNAREYVLSRDAHRCQWCHGTSRDPILNVHHIESRKTGGDSPENLVTLCETCHQHIHRTHQEHAIKREAGSLRDATQMGIIRWRIYERAKALFPSVHLTYGYLTKHTRISHNLEKSHLIDARCISGRPLARSDGTWYLLKFVRRNNRQLHKATIKSGGKRQSNKAPREVHGFRLFDCVNYQGTTCFVFSRRISGYFALRRLDCTIVHSGANAKKLHLIQRASTCLIEPRCGTPPML
ncbi:MAG TPA: RNA-guided endonuclease IscB [Ktedonobacteraceae bacterium]|nr:RNA-guided endonuclease IscB [Ktedonobacteraceae bacterium]